ncbi:biopolymer transporter ExbD [Ramlibacter solisilvae]|uniref:Biopolymer transporter ExbD n=1 Tax=Ramlibacter tataouinensis TaxID=94132 RepID=A0A127JTR0_9BURK|nr:biopolymer transporter ExbD [Ramlibacter tataouinensis]AMO23356.1 biopolymer transporter ExbD [Ramlibacter tataouinensis]
MIPIDDPDTDADVMAEINTTPLVDVLLVLLVMLVISIPVQLHAVNLEMPSTQAPPPPVEPRIVRLDVTPGGAFLWDGQALGSREELEARLREAAALPDQPEIHLRPDRRAKYESVAAALAAAQRLGLAKIGLVGAEQFSR